MRLETITQKKQQLSAQIQSFDKGDISDRIVDQFGICPRRSLKRAFKQRAALPVVKAMQPYIRATLATHIDFQHDLLCLGERFGNEAAETALLRLLKHERVDRVLIPGCYLGRDDVQFWLQRGVSKLDGVDVYSLKKRWDEIVPRLETHYRAKVHFQQGSIEQLPYGDASFDLIASSAVLEHVRNLRATAQETARVLRPGGWAAHDFGPLYYTFSGDHCIGAYGDASAYDHLLLDDADYMRRIDAQTFFDTQSDPNLPFWARRDQFSYALASEYLEAFRPDFHIRHVIVKVCTNALEFRAAHPTKWKRLLEAGIKESDLLTKSLSLALQKR